MGKVKIPSTAEIRSEIREIIEACEQLDLVSALHSGDRLDSYEPFVKWLGQGRNPELYLRQMAEAILFELHERKAKNELKEIQRQALTFLID